MNLAGLVLAGTGSANQGRRSGPGVTHGGFKHQRMSPEPVAMMYPSSQSPTS